MRPVIRPAPAGVSIGTMPRRIALPLALALFPLAHASTAHAAPEAICLVEADPAPDWWTPGITAARRESRWSGADVHEQTDGTRTARLRSIWSPQWDKIYFELRVEGDVALDDEDAFVLAISDVAQTVPELYVEIHPNEQCPHWSNCSAGEALDASSITYAEATAGVSSLTWGDLTEDNPSSDFTIHHPWIRTARVGSSFTWTLSFAMTVPTTGGDFVDRRIYGNAIVYDPGFTSGTYDEFPLWCTSSSVTTNDCLLYGGPSPDLPQDLPVGTMNQGWPTVEAGACGA